MRTFSGGRNTVPQIFFNSEHLGGSDDVHKVSIIVTTFFLTFIIIIIDIKLDEQGLLAPKVDYIRKNAVTMMQDHWYHPWY